MCYKWNNMIGQNLLLHSSNPLISPSNQCILYVGRLSCVFVFMELNGMLWISRWAVLKIHVHIPEISLKYKKNLTWSFKSVLHFYICNPGLIFKLNYLTVLAWKRQIMLCLTLDNQLYWKFLENSSFFKEKLHFCRYVFVGFFWNLEARYFEIIIRGFPGTRDGKSAT